MKKKKKKLYITADYKSLMGFVFLIHIIHLEIYVYVL